MIKRLIQNMMLAVLSTVITLLCFEFGLRIYFRHNLFLSEQDLTGMSSSLYDYDKNLGWIVKSKTIGQKWGQRIQTLEDGIRSNGRPVQESHETIRILALGDSFTFGDEAADEETWPACLETRLNREFPHRSIRVLNAGVSGYGIDQMILRAERLIPKYRPDAVILSFIIDDLYRNRQYIRYGVGKPYFNLSASGELRLENTPVPLLPLQKNKFRKYFLVHSYLSSFIEKRIAPAAWKQSRASTVLDLPYSDDEHMKLSCVLLERLLQLTRQYGCQVVFVMEEDAETDETSPFHQSFRNYFEQLMRTQQDVRFVDIIESLRLERKQNPQEAVLLFHATWNYHMSGKGNDFVAAQIVKIAGNWLMKPR